MRPLFLVIAFAFAFTLVASAQLAPMPIPKPDDNRPILRVQEGQAYKPLALTRADIHVVIDGFIAETTMTLTFHNDSSRVAEGELTIPLPEGATVSGYGLDVNGVMVDGVPVEKHKARITFETEVRKGVDPGIVEQIKGNNYRTRIYPIPAQGDRTVKLQYVSDLNQQHDSASYTLPMNWGEQPVGTYHIKVELANAPAEPVLGGSAARDLQLRTSGSRIVTERTYQNAKFPDDLVITLPRLPANHAIVEKRDTQHYFVINDRPIPPVQNRETNAPVRIGILWDASLSRANADKTRELELLKRLVSRHQGLQVDLVIFRDKPERPIEFTAAKLEDLLKLLSSVKYDGGTDLADLHIAKNPQQLPFEHPWEETPPNYNYWLLFTDGLANLMGDLPRKIEAPVYVISNDARADHAVLVHLAKTSGGQYFNLKRDTDEQVVSSVGIAPFSLIAVEHTPAEVEDILPRGATPVRDRMVISGRLRADQATITLVYGLGTLATSRQTITLRKEGAGETGLASRFWAQQKVAELSGLAEKNRDELLRLGREFGIVTPNTSLMVLERLEQYLEYQITPPKTRAEIYNAYVKQIEKRQTEQKKSAEQKLEAVVKMWDARVKWWETQYKYDVGFKYVPPREDDRGGTGGAGGLALPSPRAARAGEVREHAGRLDPNSPRPTTPAPPAQVVAALPSLAAGNADLMDAAKSDGRIDSSSSTIRIKEWDPETPYLVVLKNAKPADTYNLYIEQRAKYAASPAFYLDCADFFLKREQRDIGIRILTNVAELELENPALLRIAAHRLAQIGEMDLAIDLFEKVLAMRPEEPQSYRDLALVLIDRAEKDAANRAQSLSERTRNDLLRAMELLNKVVTGTCDGRFPEIEVIALVEFNRLIAHLRSIPRSEDLPIPLDKRLIKLMDVDVRISLTWDADATDIDLWVTEPSGEKCFYEHVLTTIGGLISKDFTQGYGPEEYCLRKAMKGGYTIQANFYGSSQQKLTGPTTIQATIFTNYGRADEKRQSITLRLVDKKETIDIGTIRLGE